MNRINRLVSGALLALALTTLPATSKGETCVIPVNDFSGINVTGDIDVTLTSSDTPSARIETDDVTDVLIEQRKQMLNISLSDKARNHHKKLKINIYLTAPTVTTYMADKGADIEVIGNMDTGRRDVSIDIHSNAEIEFDNLSCNKLTVNATGGAEADMTRLSAEQVDVKATTRSEVEMSGKASVINLSAVGGAKIKAANLTADEATVIAASGSQILCNSTGRFSQTTDVSSMIRNLARQ